MQSAPARHRFLAVAVLAGVVGLFGLPSCSSQPIGEDLGSVSQPLTCATAADCPTGTPCRTAICDPNEHVCAYSTVDAACDDSNSCTSSDVCVQGSCVGGPPASGCSVCAAAAVVPADGGVFTGAVTGNSTMQGTCIDSAGSPERVYSWTPTRSGVATFATCGGTTNYDTALYLLNSTCAVGSQIACNDDTPNCPAADGLPNNTQHGSRITQNVTAGTTYYVVVDGWGGRRGNYSLTITPPTVCGDSVREGGELCDGSDAAGCVSGVCKADCTCQPPAAGQPDLVPTLGDISVAYNSSVPSGDVIEGCAGSTTGNNLLRFSAYIANQGTADISLGDPGCPNCDANPLVTCANPAFVCSPAGGHNHGHYSNYAIYELIDSTTAIVATGHKQGFCLRDNSCAAGISPKFGCANQGISAGCSDVYDATLGCQYIDITGVAPGTYTLRVRVDPFNRFPESNEANNDATATVVIPDPNAPQPPSTDVVPPEGGTVSGTTSGPSAASGTCAAQSGSAPERVLTWTPTESGTAKLTTCGATGFDTVLYVRSGSEAGAQLACNDDTAGCGTRDGSAGSGGHGSSININVVAGTTYYIYVDGFAGSTGGSAGPFVLNVTAPTPAPPAPTPDVIPSSGGTVTGTTSGTSLYSGTCAAAATASAPDHAYSWVAPKSGTAKFTTCGTSSGGFDTVLYVGGTLGGSNVGCNDDSNNCAVGDGSAGQAKHGSIVSANVVAGQTYYIHVDGFTGSSGRSVGNYTLNVTPPP